MAVLGDKLLEEAKKYYRMTEIMNSNVLSDFVGVNVKTTPWCAAFINALLKSLDLPQTGSNLARSFLMYGREIPSITMASPGDIVILRRGNSSWQGHVGLLNKDVTVSDPTIELLGGNQGDSVKISSFPRKSILGVRRVE